MPWQLQATEPLTSKWNPISVSCLFFRMWDSKYLVSIFPRRHCDHQCHNGNPDEEHMQLLSLNKISQFPLHPSTMGLSPGRWLSSYTPGAIIAAKTLPLTTLTHFTPLLSSAFTSPHPNSLRGSDKRSGFCHKWHIFTSSLLLFTLYRLFSLHSPRRLSTFATFPLTQRKEWETPGFLWLLLIWSISGYFSCYLMISMQSTPLSGRP